MQDVWFSDAAKTAYPILAWLFPYIASLEHCTAECEREFSVLARLLTPLRRGKILRRLGLRERLSRPAVRPFRRVRDASGCSDGRLDAGGTRLRHVL